MNHEKNALFLIVLLFLAIVAGCEDAKLENINYESSQTPIKNLDAQAQANHYADIIINSFSTSTRSSSNSTQSAEGQKNFHPSYGGCYINHNGKLVVLIANKDNNYKKYIQNLVGPQNVIFRFCDNSYNSLLSVLDSLNNYKFKTCVDVDYSNFRHFRVRMLKNKIEVYLDNYSEQKIEEFKSKVHNSSAIIFSESDGDFVLQSSLNPGEVINNQIYNGSIGYRARDKEGNVGIVVSGHHIRSGETVYKNTTPIGYCEKSQERDDIDAAFVEVFDGYLPTNNIGGSYGMLSTTVSNPQVGTMITMYGQVSKNKNGKILDTSDTYDSRNTGGPIYTDLVRADYVSANGDSGGIIFTVFGYYTLGVHVGVGRSGIGEAYYCKASNINQRFGLTRY